MKKHATSKGFTLIELLLVISLIAIVAGFSSDIIVSLVRSYNKTKVTTEIEQVANFALQKLEKELKSAKSVTSACESGGSSSSSITFVREIDNVDYTVTYAVDSGNLTRSQIAVGDSGTATVINVVEPTTTTGVAVSSGTNTFTCIQSLTGPAIVRTQLTFQQIGTGGSKIFDGDLTIEQTVVLRGTY